MPRRFFDAAGRTLERLFIRTGYDSSSMDKDRARRLDAQAGRAGEPRSFPRALARFNYRERRQRVKGAQS